MKNLILLSFLILISCKSEVNQYQTIKKNVQLKTGKWIEEDDYPEQKYVSIGIYKRGEKVGKWKIYLNGKIYQKDRFKDSITHTKFYYPDGKILKKGVSKTIKDHKSIFWYFHGKWKFYDENGKLEYIKIYYRDSNKTDSINVKKRTQ